MNKFFRFAMFAVALSSMAWLTSCDEDPALPDNNVVFQTSSAGLAEDATEVTVSLTLVRAAEADGSIVVAYTPTGLTYGDDFATEPAAEGGKVTIPVATGATSASFKVIKTNTTGLEGSEKVDFTIESASEGLVVGEAKTFSLTFSEIIATSATMQVNGGGPTAPNIVFIDLSGNAQTAVERISWDLAFASDADRFTVLLNSTTGMLARELTKNDLTDVNEDDTVGFAAQLGIGAIQVAASVEEGDPLPDWLSETTKWMDSPTGNLDQTALIVYDEDDENQVFIVNRGTGPGGTARGWVKLRLLRDGAGYAVQYADINATTFNTVSIQKNTETRFQFLSLTSGEEVDVEPKTGDWDIAWTGFTNTFPTSFTDPTAPLIPYYFSDMIITNVNAGGVSTFTYTNGTTGDKTFDTFTEADLSVITNYSTSQIGIGSSWRTAGGPPPSPPAGVNASRFYVVKDAEGNIYKLQFTKLTSDAGERGKPEFKFELLKKGS